MTRLPGWLRAGPQTDLHSARELLRRHGLTTVCEEARCPNRGVCFSRPTATFLILGPTCTRSCGFCAVRHGFSGRIDPDEPRQVAEAAAEMGLRYVVITSVTRDDLPDGGAVQFVRTIEAARNLLPSARIEVLTPDFQGCSGSVESVLGARPDVFNHNMETVERLQPVVRSRADYRRSLRVIERSARFLSGGFTKSGFMLGLGERTDEVVTLLRDLRSAGCEIVTMGQYLRPTKRNLPVVEYIRPEVFEELKQTASGMGFRFVASGPLVRSSMNAEEMYGAVPGASSRIADVKGAGDGTTREGGPDRDVRI